MGITNKYLSLILTIALMLSTSCKKSDSPPPQVPQVSIAGIASITSSSAVAGGSIISNGGLEISSSGFCWSKNNPLPLISDDTTKITVSVGEFTAEISNLEASSQYFIRSYAINSQGTGYSEVTTFNTGNAPPAVNNIQIEGSMWVGGELTVKYDYFDAENDVERNSVIRWYTATDTTDYDTIAASTGVLYKLMPTDETKFIRVGVTPIAATGSLAGTESQSYWVGPVDTDPIIVRFRYNGAEVTYGVITSPFTGRKWLDRNLGAPNAPEAYNDFADLGDLFQWGRVPDGHQLIVRHESGAAGPLTGTTEQLTSNDIPYHSLFIINPNSPYDWRVPQNDNLWQESGINNPCPSGWHIPTLEEWKAEAFSSQLISFAWQQLRLTLTGYRYGIDGNVSGSESLGLYWTSTPVAGGGFNLSYEIIFSTNNEPNPVTTDMRASGAACRCIKDLN